MKRATPQLLPIDQAAKAAGLCAAYARAISLRTGIAIRVGGNDRHPWLRVRLEDLERAVRSEPYRKAHISPTPTGFFISIARSAKTLENVDISVVAATFGGEESAQKMAEIPRTKAMFGCESGCECGIAERGAK